VTEPLGLLWRLDADDLLIYVINNLSYH